jgi:CheY-like chemotaxis protein
VLIVEDDPVIAVDYHFQLKDVGATAEGFKATNREALSYLASHDVDAAIVDYLLCDGTGESIIDGLKSRGIPFIVVSGCAFRMHGEVDQSRVLSKPVAPGEIWRALSEVLH